MENIPPNGESAKSGLLVVRLPWLREMPACFGSGKYEMSGLCRLWPGLNNIPAGYWHKPDNYPLEPEIAQKFLADLEDLDADELAYAQNLGIAVENARNASAMAEMADLSAFANGNPHNSDVGEELALLQAHKALIWIWLAQGRAAEIANLAESFGQKAAQFSGILAEGEDTPPAMPDAGISLDENIMPSWQTVFLNAVRFLPPDAAIFAEGPMRADLLERENFEPAPEFGEGICHTQLPLWKIVGNRRLPALFERTIRVFTFIG